MGIQCRQSEKDINDLFAEIARIIRDEILRTLKYLGEQCNTRIRDRSAKESWIDRTGNLRSSIGYAVFDYGKKAVESSFKVVLEGNEGIREGRRYIDELASEFAKTYALVVVAGMSYAEYVEAIESKDVLASTELWAKSKVDEYMMKTRQRIERRINKLLAA